MICAIFISFIINIALGSVVPDIALMGLYVIAVLPFFVIGFVTYNGLPGEKAAALFIRYAFASKKLKREDTNFLVMVESKAPEKPNKKMQ